MLKCEKSASGSLPADVNVAWSNGFRQRIKERALSIYDKGCVVELPSIGELGDKLEALYNLSDRVSVLQETGGEKAVVGELKNLVTECIDECIGEMGFDFKTAYTSLYRITCKLEEELRSGQKIEEQKGAFNLFTSKHTCHFCGHPIPKYPGFEVYRCPNCGNDVKIVFDAQEGLVKDSGVKYPSLSDISENLTNIRKEVKKRSALYKNVQKMAEGKLDRLNSLKAALSCMTRVIVEEENNPDKGILGAVGEALLVDILSLFINEDTVAVQERVGKYFMPGEAKEPSAAEPGSGK